ncbi:MAG: hypothetical protein AAB909_01485 [Patescibacteria group bacterium]
MSKKRSGKARKSYLIAGDRPKSSWRRNIGKNKKISMIESKEKIEAQDDLG